MGRLFIVSIGLIGALLVTPVAAFEFPSLRQPSWQELSAQQKNILAPLGPEWDAMDDARRKKWMGIAGRYPHLSQDEQTRIQSQMREWAKLTPRQRLIVREKYRAMRKIPADKRGNVREQWERYLELPEEEKQRLQEEARSRQRAKQQAYEKSRQATSKLSAQALKPGYPLAPIQQAPAPVITLTPSLIPQQSIPIPPAFPADVGGAAPVSPAVTH